MNEYTAFTLLMHSYDQEMMKQASMIDEKVNSKPFLVPKPQESYLIKQGSYNSIILIISCQITSYNYKVTTLRIMLGFFKKSQQKPSKPLVSIFKSTNTLAQRVEKRASLRQKYPDDKFCVLVVQGLLDLPTNMKYSRPFILIGLERTMNVLHLIGYIKKLLKINEGNSIFIQAGNGTIVGMTTTMDQLITHHTETDGFVYVRVKTEDTF